MANELGVVHDGICPETGQVTCLLLRAHLFESRNWRRTPGAPLVQHQHPVVLQSALQPAGRRRVRSRPGRLHAGAALQEHEEGPVSSLRYRRLSGEERDLLAVRLGVAQWRGELVFGQDQPGDVRRNGHNPESGARRRLHPRAGSTLVWRRVGGLPGRKSRSVSVAGARPGPSPLDRPGLAGSSATPRRYVAGVAMVGPWRRSVPVTIR